MGDPRFWKSMGDDQINYHSWFTRQCSFSVLSFIAIPPSFLFGLQRYIQLVPLHCISPLYIYAYPHNSLLCQSKKNPAIGSPGLGSIFVHCPQENTHTKCSAGIYNPVYNMRLARGSCGSYPKSL